MPQPPIYDPEAVRPMEEELTTVGVHPLRTPEEVDANLKDKGTTLIVVNSVCGCAAGSARPGVTLALQHKRIPDRLATVFAGVDRDAVDTARGHMPDVPPSSPCIALFQDGELKFLLPRHYIEQMNEDMIAEHLAKAFDEFCHREGPSVPREVYESVKRAKQCGSNVPLFGR